MKSKETVSRRELLRYVDKDVKEMFFVLKICCYVGVAQLYLLMINRLW